jgi:hypothetical protein
MRILLQIASFFLMVSVGMGLRVNELIGQWRRLNWKSWACLLTAAFLTPPALAEGMAIAWMLPRTAERLCPRLSDWGNAGVGQLVMFAYAKISPAKEPEHARA